MMTGRLFLILTATFLVGQGRLMAKTPTRVGASFTRNALERPKLPVSLQSFLRKLTQVTTTTGGPRDGSSPSKCAL